MPQNRYYSSGNLQKGSTVILKNDEHHYLKNVMRTRVGESVEVINGEGALAECELVKLLDKEAHLLVTTLHQEEKSPFTLTLALAILKPAHLEYAVEKCCEIGVSKFLIFPGARSEKKSLSEQYLKRLHTIILSSTKQCGRLYLPSLEVGELKLEGKVLFGDLEATIPIADVDKKSNITLVIGPESGFTEHERQLLLQNGAQGVHLNRNTLRAETAAVVGAALLCAS